MATERERMFRQMVEEFPDSPMGHFSLGRLCLEERRHEEAAAHLAEATRLDPTYAAALVSLGDALAALGKVMEARAAYEQAASTPLGKRDQSLQEDVRQRLADLG